MKIQFTNLISKIIIAPVKIYQYAISPFIPASCRHLPTCSTYTITAIKLHGPLMGSRLAINRIGRCHPWGTAGFDPVPKILIKRIKLKTDRSKMKIEAYDLLKSKIITLLMVITIAFSACTNSGAEEQTDNQNMKVLVSIPPYKYFVDKISGKTIEVMILIPPGTSPHAYDPTPRQMVEIGKTDIYFTNGLLSFEQAWMEGMKNTHSKIKTVNLSGDIQLLEGEDVHVCDHSDDHHHHHHHHIGVDPHTWVSAANARIFAKQIYQALSKTYPSQTGIFKTNFESLIREIDELDNQIAEKLSLLPGRSFMIFHPALGYFARDYNLKQISIEFEGKEPSPQQLKKSIQDAKDENIKTILIQKEFDKENANIIAIEIGGKVIQIDPLDENWIEGMHQIAEAIYASWK